MPRRRQLTMDERRVILNLHEQTDISTDEIGAIVNRVRGTVHKLIINPNKKAADSISGLPPKVTENKKRRLLRKARTRRYTARQILAQVEMNISLSRLRQILNADDNLRWTRLEKKPHMTALHHQRRLQWGTGHLTWNAEQWTKVIWSDENI